MSYLTVRGIRVPVVGRTANGDPLVVWGSREEQKAAALTAFHRVMDATPAEVLAARGPAFGLRLGEARRAAEQAARDEGASATDSYSIGALAAMQWKQSNPEQPAQKTSGSSVPYVLGGAALLGLIGLVVWGTASKQP